MHSKKRKFDDSVKIIVVGHEGVGKTSLISQFVEKNFDEAFIQTIGINFKMKIVNLNDKKEFFQWQFDYSELNNIFQELREHAGENISRVLIGNKLDFQDQKQREVSFDEGERVAAKNNIKFYECSAKDGTKVDEAFIDLTKIIMKNHETSVKREKLDKRMKKRSSKERSLCCK